MRALVTGLAASLLLLMGGCGYGHGAAAPAGITTGPNSHVHLLSVQRDGSLLLGDQEGLWRSASRGKHWRPFGDPIRHLMPICEAQIGRIMLVGTTGLSANTFGTPKGLWRSTDGGRHWRLTSLPDKYVTILAANPIVSKTVVALAQPDASSGAGHGGIWVSTDTGLTWRRINTSLAGRPSNGIVLLQGRPFTILWAGSLGIERSADAGKHWRLIQLGQAQTLSLAASPLGPSFAFAGAGSLGTSGSGIWVSLDSGGHWRPQWRAPPTPLLAPTLDLAHLVYGYAAAGKPFLYAASRITGVKSEAPAFKSTVPVAGAQPAQLVADPKDPRRLYAAYSFPLRIYESSNAGSTWRKIL